MTVQELFNHVGFEAVMSALQNTHRNEKSIKGTAYYKQAFDKLLMTEPSGRGGEVTFDVTPREKWFDPGFLPMLANAVEGDLWEDIIGKEVIKPEDNPFSDAELAGAILWGATFYGFTDHNRWTPFNDIHTRYGKLAQDLERKLYDPYIRDVKTLNRLKTDSLLFGIAFPREVWKEIHFHQKHQNRQKRKRFYRMKKRIRELERLDKRAHAIAKIEAKTGKSLGSLADKIIHAGSICEEWRDCHTYPNDNRVDYAIDLMSNYFPTASDILSVGEEIIIVFYTSPENPLKAEESARLQEYFNTQADTSALHFFDGTDPDTASALDIQFIRISDTVIPDEDED